MTIKIILWASVIWLVPILYFLMKNEAKFKKNIAVGVTFPYEGRQDPDVLAALARFKRRLRLVCLALIAVAVPCFFAQGFGLIMGLWCGWIDLCIVAPYVPYVLCNRELKRIKAAKGYSLVARDAILIDTAAIPHSKWLSPWVFAGAFALSLAPLLWERTFVIVYLAFGLSVALSFFCYRYCCRNKLETVDENVELSRALTQVRRHNWGVMWVITAYSLSGMSLAFSLFPSLPILSLALQLLLCFVLTLALINVELKTRRAQETLTRDSGQGSYVDEDDKWLGGMFYYNPSDSRTIINNRVGTNSTVNLAKPGGIILVGAVALLLVAMPFLGAALSVSASKPLTLEVENGYITAAQGRSEYSVALEEVVSLQLVEELPEGLTRTWGTGMDNLLKGRFSSDSMDHITLCLDPTAPPFILIGMEDGTCCLFGTRNPDLTAGVCAQLANTEELADQAVFSAPLQTRLPWGIINFGNKERSGADVMFSSRLKRTCSGLLAAASLFSICGSASAQRLFPFRDVPKDVWYREAAVYAWYQGLFSGTSSTTFSPETTMTRAMLVTVLYSMAGSPEVETDTPFTDVEEGVWYQKPVAWAWQEGITSGTSATTFSPQDPLTREQLVTLLWQYARLQGYDTSGRASLDRYSDAGSVSAYAREPFRWAVSIGIISGTSSATLSPSLGATRAQVAQILMQFCRNYGVFERDAAAQLPVLMYHHLTQEGDSNSTISYDLFTQHLEAMEDAGYTAVSIQDLLDYVYEDADLPENPVLITFDDGYLSNYETAYPLLEEYGMQATIFVIGASVGKDTYKDTGIPIIPHFSLEQGEEMEASGLIELQSHTYDFHQVSALDPEPVRAGMLQLQGESDGAYIALIQEDCARMRDLLPHAPVALAYPYGQYSQKCDSLLAQEGIQVTFTMAPKPNTLLRGDTQSLRLLGRYNMNNSVSVEKLLELLEG